MEKEKLFCVICENELKGNQKKYCCSKCRNKGSHKNSIKSPETRQKYQKIQNQNRILLKYQLLEAKGGKCSNCGYDKNIAALEFHHLDPDEKDFAISSSTTTNFDKLFLEVEKCVILCANCHREFHHPELDIELVSKLENNHKRPEPKKIKTCSECDGPISPSSRGLCQNCYGKLRVNKNKPSKEELFELIKFNSFLELGRLFKVSDTIIRRWCKEYELPYLLKDRKLLRLE